MKHIAYIGVGSNLGDKVYQCEQSLREILRVDHHRLLARSSFYKTQPLGFLDQDWFVNGAFKIETFLEPLELLRSLKEIELRLGRRESFRWGPRAIDLDILFFDDETIRTRELIIPHPRLEERQFVLVPLVEIDRHLVHPVLQKTILQLLESLKEDQGVEKLQDIPEF
jgi:2-amino-4-hydroxy-6-hydroxymethyldihydropteridine diphosphokinase